MNEDKNLPEYHRNFHEEEYDLLVTIKVNFQNEDGDFGTDHIKVRVKHISSYPIDSDALGTVVEAHHDELRAVAHDYYENVLGWSGEELEVL